MNWDQIKYNWQAVCEQIKLTWGKLSENDLASIAGSREQLTQVLHERYGYTKSDAETRVDQFAHGLHE